MPLHDAYARLTPFELAFPDPDAVDDFVRSVEEEAEAREVDASDRMAFSMLGSVGSPAGMTIVPRQAVLPCRGNSSPISAAMITSRRTSGSSITSWRAIVTR